VASYSTMWPATVQCGQLRYKGCQLRYKVASYGAGCQLQWQDSSCVAKASNSAAKASNSAAKGSYSAVWPVTVPYGQLAARIVNVVPGLSMLYHVVPGLSMLCQDCQCCARSW